MGGWAWRSVVVPTHPPKCLWGTPPLPPAEGRSPLHSRLRAGRTRGCLGGGGDGTGHPQGMPLHRTPAAPGVEASPLCAPRLGAESRPGCLVEGRRTGHPRGVPLHRTPPPPALGLRPYALPVGGRERTQGVLAEGATGQGTHEGCPYTEHHCPRRVPWRALRVPAFAGMTGRGGLGGREVGMARRGRFANRLYTRRGCAIKRGNGGVGASGAGRATCGGRRRGSGTSSRFRPSRVRGRRVLPRRWGGA